MFATEIGITASNVHLRGTVWREVGTNDILDGYKAVYVAGQPMRVRGDVSDRMQPMRCRISTLSVVALTYSPLKPFGVTD